MKSRKSGLSISRPHLPITIISTYLSSPFTVHINIRDGIILAETSELQRDIAQSQFYWTHGDWSRINRLQISNSLENTLNTFGPASRQYHAVLEILKECLRDIENDKKKSAELVVDPDMLSVAMGFLEIKE